MRLNLFMEFKTTPKPALCIRLVSLVYAAYLLIFKLDIFKVVQICSRLGARHHKRH